MISTNHRGIECISGPARWKVIRAIILIFFSYSLVSGLMIGIFFFVVDVLSAMEGSINGDFCSTLEPSGFGVPVGEFYTCVIHFDYVAIMFLYFPICIVFWQALFGTLVGVSIVIFRRFRKFTSAAGPERSSYVENLFAPITIASTVYVLGVFCISGVYGVIHRPGAGYIRDWWPLYLPPLEMFTGSAWPFLLAPVPLFVVVAYLRKRLR